MSDLFTLVGRIAIDASDADAKIDEITTAAKGLGTELGNTGTQANGLAANIGSGSTVGAAATWLGNMLTTLTNKAISFASGLAGTGFEYNAQMESYVTAFSTMMGGNTEKASAFIEQIRELASVTPLGMAGLAGNAQTMMGFGIAAENVVGTLRMLGDAAQGDQQKLDSIVLAYSQIMAAGKINAQDANQLINAGVPIWSLLAEHIGATVSEVRSMSEEGSITSETVNAALQKATSEGGLYFEAMAKQAETFNGQLSTMKDNSDQTLGNVFQPFFDVAKGDVLPRLNESLGVFGEWVTNNKETLQSFATTVGGAVTGAFDSLISGFQWIVENGEAVKVGLGAIVAGILAATIVAHPLASAIVAVVAALAMMQTGGSRAENALLKYSDEELATLQEYVDAVNAAKEAEAAYFENEMSQYDVEKNKAWLDTAAKKKEAEAKVNGIDGLMQAYDNWRGTHVAEGTYIDVPLRPSEDSMGAMQTDIDGYELSGEASINAAANSEALIQTALNAMDLEADVTLNPKMSGLSGLFSLLGIPGFATGLDRVPEDNFLARLHKDEAVLTASEAAIWRGEKQPRASAFNRRNTRETSDQPITVNLTVNGNSGSPYEIAGAVRDALEMVRWGV